MTNLTVRMSVVFGVVYAYANPNHVIFEGHIQIEDQLQQEQHHCLLVVRHRQDEPWMKGDDLMNLWDYVSYFVSFSDECCCSLQKKMPVDLFLMILSKSFEGYCLSWIDQELSDTFKWVSFVYAVHMFCNSVLDVILYFCLPLRLYHCTALSHFLQFYMLLWVNCKRPVCSNRHQSLMQV